MMNVLVLVKMMVIILMVTPLSALSYKHLCFGPPNFKFKFIYVAVYHKYVSKDFTQKEKPVNYTIKRRNAVSNMKHKNRP